MAARTNHPPSTLPYRLCLTATACYWSGMALLTHLPLREEVAPPGWFDFPHVDKVIHTALFATLAFVLTLTLDVRARVAPPGSPLPRTTRHILAYSAIIAYACFDEVTQPLTGRHCDLFDLLADACGAGLGMVVYRFTHRDATPHR